MIIKKIIRRLIIFLIASILLIITLFGQRDIPLDLLKKKYANSHSSFISLDGMSVHYRDEGNVTDSIPLVLIHGTGASLHTFDSWTKILKNDRRIIRMDLPGYGLTGPFADRNYSIKNYVLFLKKFLIGLGIKQCVIGGNSLGGQIAWNYTLENKEMVNKLILVDAAGYPVLSKSTPIIFKIAKIPIIKNIFTYITPRFIVKSSVKNVYFDKNKVNDIIVDRYFELGLREGNRQAFIDRFSIKSDTKTYLNINEIEQPTLILWGSEDYLIPLKTAKKFQKDLPNNTLVIIKDVGHIPMEEQSIQSAEIVLSFLKNTI